MTSISELPYFQANPRQSEYEAFLKEWAAEWANRDQDNFNPDKKMDYVFTFKEVLTILSQNPVYSFRKEEDTKAPVNETVYLDYPVLSKDNLMVRAMIIALDDSFIMYTYASTELAGVTHNGHLTLPVRMVDRDANCCSLMVKTELILGDSRLPAMYERHMLETGFRIGNAQNETVTEHTVPEQTQTRKDTCDGVSRMMLNDVTCAALGIAMRDGHL